MKKSNKRKGMDFEKKVEKCINSGALSFDRGDLKTSDYVLECKFTEKKGYRITTKTLQKIWDDALEANKLPKIIIGIKEENVLWTIDLSIQREVK